MFMFSRVGIVGTGLIGGSLGMALKQRRIAKTVVGTGRSAKNLNLAVKSRALDSASTDLNILTDCDLVIFATPVDALLSQIGPVKNIVGGDCLAIDVASTKAEIVAKAGKAFSRFVGCHPLAGSEKSGVANARPDMFEKAVCVITPAKSTDKKAVDAVISMWRALGARIQTLSPEKHDSILAHMSHLPHVIAYALAGSAPEQYLSFAPPSFREMTRIAGSDPAMWAGIFMSNKKSLSGSIDIFCAKLLKLRDLMQKEQTGRIIKILSESQKKRGKIK